VSTPEDQKPLLFFLIKQIKEIIAQTLKTSSFLKKSKKSKRLLRKPEKQSSFLKKN